MALKTAGGWRLFPSRTLSLVPSPWEDRDDGSKARKEADGTAEKRQGEHIVGPKACGKGTLLISYTTLFCIEC